MQRWGTTAKGTPRFFCTACGRTATRERPDVRSEHHRERLVAWLTGVQSKAEIAKRYGVSRQTLTEEFRDFFAENLESPIPPDTAIELLIVDAKYIHRRVLCVLVAVTEQDRIFWRFAPEERYGTWKRFLAEFLPPKVVVADGQKGMSHFVKRHWPQTAFQRCHFHMVLLLTHYLTRHPTEEAGRVILDLAHRLKDVKAPADRDRWLLLHRLWEKRYERAFGEKTESGGYRHRKLRSVRTVMRRSVPNLFTYLDYPGCPNTTNLVEGWVNTAIAEGLGRHRGLTLSQKQTLVSVILSNLRRPTREKPTRKFP